jgi:putative nucleotidyltransferase with HDIG domain
MGAEKKSTQKQDTTQNEMNAAKAADDQHIADRFRYRDLDDPLFKALHGLAQAWAGRAGTWNSGRMAATFSGLSTAEIKSRLAVLPQQEIAHLLRDDPQLPPMPHALEELREITADERVSVEDIGEVLLKDAGLSAFLLRLVNSPFYGLSSRVDTISRAVSFIGIKPLYSLALGFVFSEIIARAPKNMPGLDTLWKHSLAVGIVAQTIWKTQESREDSERLFVAGLLHDVGKLVLMCTDSERARILYEQSEEDVASYDLEDKVLGFDHAKLGGALLKTWNMPVSLVTAVQWHHNPYSAAHYKEPAVVHLSDMLVNGLGLGMRPRSPVPALSRHSTTLYHLKPGTLELAVETLSERLEDIYASLKS